MDTQTTTTDHRTTTTHTKIDIIKTVKDHQITQIHSIVIMVPIQGKEGMGPMVANAGKEETAGDDKELKKQLPLLSRYPLQFISMHH